jgi:hypothetical protein
MRNPTLRLFSFLMLISLGLPLVAQQASLRPPGNLVLSLFHNQAADSLALQGYQPGWGFSMDMLSASLMRQSPIQLQLGGRVDYTQNGRFRTEMDLLEPLNGRADYRLVNQQVGIFGMGRLITRPARLRLYVDGMAGLRVHSTVESYDLIGAYPGYEDQVSDAVLEKATFSYGGAAGMEVRLGQGVALDVRMLYTQSGQAPFANLQDARLIEKQVSYPVVQSPIEQLGFQVGISLEMRDEEEEIVTREGCCCCERNIQPRLPNLPPPTDPRPLKPVIKN